MLNLPKARLGVLYLRTFSCPFVRGPEHQLIRQLQSQARKDYVVSRRIRDDGKVTNRAALQASATDIIFRPRWDDEILE